MEWTAPDANQANHNNDIAHCYIERHCNDGCVVLVQSFSKAFEESLARRPRSQHILFPSAAVDASNPIPLGKNSRHAEIKYQKAGLAAPNACNFADFHDYSEDGAHDC